jgi:hypothetical protein
MKVLQYQNGAKMLQRECTTIEFFNRFGEATLAKAMTGKEAASFLVREDGPIRIGVSACLLGEEVRFDGGHKRADFLVLVPSCRLSRRSVSRGTPSPSSTSGQTGTHSKYGPRTLGRPDLGDEAVRRATGGGARGRGALRLRAQEQFPELRDGARAGVRCGRGSEA